jgi:hypothetical protein
VRLVVVLINSLAAGAFAAHIAEAAATMVGTRVAHGWSYWSG